MTTLLPQNNEAEQAVLGALLLGSRNVAEDVADTLQGHDFYQPAHEEIFDACQAIYRRGERADPVLVARQLGNQLQRVGGAPYLHTLTAACPITANATYWADIVAERALARRLVEAGMRISQLGYQTENALEAAEHARQLADDAAAHVSTDSPGLTLSESLPAAIDFLEAEQVGMPTPWPDLDRITHGVHPGQLVTIGARPGNGKSVAALNIARLVAETGAAVHFSSLEMSRNELVTRVISAKGSVDLGRMIGHRLDENDWRRISDAQAALAGIPLVIDEDPSQTMAQIRARARTTKRRMGSLGLIVIDYAQLVTPTDSRAPREQQVADISRKCKLMGKELHVPVLLLAQLNRGSAQRSDHKPVLTDLRESGGLEQDSDQVWLLHRPDLVGDEERLGEQDVIVAKNRNGQTATATLAFQGHYARSVSMV